MLAHGTLWVLGSKVPASKVSRCYVLCILDCDWSGFVDCWSVDHHNQLSLLAASSCSWMSVMAGGQLQGWSPDSACALWFRVFGVIGPLNKIQNPVSHKFALESVNRIVDMLHLVSQSAL